MRRNIFEIQSKESKKGEEIVYLSQSKAHGSTTVTEPPQK
jgi:hypothetical protein